MSLILTSFADVGRERWNYTMHHQTEQRAWVFCFLSLFSVSWALHREWGKKISQRFFQLYYSMISFPEVSTRNIPKSISVDYKRPLHKNTFPIWSPVLLDSLQTSAQSQGLKQLPRDTNGMVTGCCWPLQRKYWNEVKNIMTGCLEICQQGAKQSVVDVREDDYTLPKNSSHQTSISAPTFPSSFSARKIKLFIFSIRST